MTQNDDVTNTNSASKEYWEARAANEREEAKMTAFRRRFAIGILVVMGALVLWIISLFH